MNNLLSLSMLTVILSLAGCDRKADNPQALQSLTSPLTVERLYSSPLLSGEKPVALKISPDGKRVTFLKGKKEDFRILDLWQFELTTGKESLLVDSQVLLGDRAEALSDEEKARRERKRIFAKGIVEYQWSTQGDKLLFPINGDLYLYDLKAEQPVTQLTATDDFELDPRFSPKGNYVSFIRRNNLYLIQLSDMSERQITFAGTQDQPMGIAEFVAQEEMRRFRGYWWSPDERQIAVTQVDNRPVGSIERFELYADKISLIEQSYPKAGAANAAVRLAILDISGEDPQALKLNWVPIDTVDYYLPQIKWLPTEGRAVLAYSVQSRDQKRLDFWLYRLGDERAQRLLQETDRAWVNIRHDFRFLKNAKQLLWVSEKSGHAQIHRFDWQGNELKPLTSGDFEVLAIKAVDEETGKVYFTANKGSVLEQHLYEVSLNGETEPNRISERAGIHEIIMNPDQPHFYIDNFSSPEQPFQISLHQLDGTRDFHIKENAVAGAHPLAKYQGDLSNWEYSEYQSESGYTLHYKILKPKNFQADEKYPLIQFVYGGPGPQMVRKGWGDLFHQLLAQRGFVVLVADNRGTPNRGRDFEREYYLNFGRVEVEDQSQVLRHVCMANSYLDCRRVGVYGHSYGGYLSLMLMLQKADLYQVGVAGAPVVDWRLYDTHYTERYIGKPQDQEAVYRRANVLSYIDNLKGRLLTVHGMADDNVLYNHSLQLYQALQNKGKMFDLMAYPGAKHGIRGKREWQIHYRNTIVNYFSDHLQQ